jgi:type I restriction enzyme, R subunit
MDKRGLSERDICTKFITPAIERGGWDVQTEIRENVHLTSGRVMVRGKLVARGEKKFADYVLRWKPNVPLAVVEDKDNNHPVGDGIQRALKYTNAEQLAEAVIPSVASYAGTDSA